MQRLDQSRNPSIFDVVDRFYWDVARKRPKFGITSRKTTAGQLRHHLPVRIRQLEKICDLKSLYAAPLIEFLDQEFPFARP